MLHRHKRPTLSRDNPLAGKVLYIPAMDEGAATVMAAVFRWVGIEAYPTPPSTDLTLTLGSTVTNGDECFPAQVTLGDLLRIVREPGFEASRTAFLMATSDGPCRFGQYAVYLRRLLQDLGYGDIEILSPSDRNGYTEFGDVARPVLRGVWRAMVATDMLRKLLLKTRPYETSPGSSDDAYRCSIEDLSRTIELGCARASCQLEQMATSLRRARERFRTVSVCHVGERPLIGVVGEIFCRLNTFSNQDLIRRLESYGAETRLTDISEWIHYVHSEEVRHLRRTGLSFSRQMLTSRVRHLFLQKDERTLIAALYPDLGERHECSIAEILELAEPYLPAEGVCGEMVLSAGRAAWLAKHGADGIIDISPFTCMNGIVSEAIYPRLSKDYGGIPIRNFYFDGTQTELDRDLGIYMEIVQSYRERKTCELANPLDRQPPFRDRLSYASPAANSGIRPAEDVTWQ